MLYAIVLRMLIEIFITHFKHCVICLTIKIALLEINFIKIFPICLLT